MIVYGNDGYTYWWFGDNEIVVVRIWQEWR